MMKRMGVVDVSGQLKGARVYMKKRRKLSSTHKSRLGKFARAEDSREV
jgi:hypothetical protein